MYILSTIVSYCYLHSSIDIFCLVLCDHFHLHIINDFQHLFHTLYVYLWVGEGNNMVLGMWLGWGCSCLVGGFGGLLKMHTQALRGNVFSTLLFATT